MDNVDNFLQTSTCLRNFNEEAIKNHTFNKQLQRAMGSQIILLIKKTREVDFWNHFCLSQLTLLAIKICAILVQRSYTRWKVSEGKLTHCWASAWLPVNEMRTRRKGRGPKSNSMTRTMTKATKHEKKPQEPL